MAGGKKKVDVDAEPVKVLFPVGLYDDMIKLIRTDRRWFDRQDFIKEAVKEKIERHRAARAGPPGPPPPRVGLGPGNR